MAKILLVEDDKSLRQMYGERLLAEGFDIVSAGDGEEALSMAINEMPDLIISDVMMPKISGFEMLDLLRTNAKTSGIKVIVMTALGGENQKQRGEKLGANRYLVKSQVGIEDVVATVHDVLNESQPSATPQANETTQTDLSSNNQVQSPSNIQPAPAANQSPFNPERATSPSNFTPNDPVKLPDSPFTVPTILTQPAPSATNAPTNPVAQFTQQPVPASANIQSESTTPSAPVQPNAGVLPPVQTPSGSGQVQPNSQPQDQHGSTLASGLRTIQPTGESLNPKLNLDKLLANEEAIEIAPNLTVQPVAQTQQISTPKLAAAPNTQASAPLEIPNLDVVQDENKSPEERAIDEKSTIPEIEVDDSGTINVDSIPEPTTDNNLFPTNK